MSVCRGWRQDIFDIRTVVCLVAWRVLNVLLLSAASAPDEYWQGPEVAHQLVFGYGELTWEWRDPARIRSVLYPLVCGAPMLLLKVLVSLRCSAVI